MMALWVRPDLENIFGKFSSCSSFHDQKMRKKKKYENCAKSRCLTCFWRKKETDKCIFFFYLKTIGNRVLFIYLCIFERALTIHTNPFRTYKFSENKNKVGFCSWRRLCRIVVYAFSSLECSINSGNKYL